MTRPVLTLLCALLAACSSDPSDDSAMEEGGGSSESGEAGGTDGDESEGSSSESGEPAPEWPPECVGAGECAGLELVLDAECSGEYEVLAVDAIWMRSAPDASPVSAAAGCGEPLRATAYEPGTYSVRLAVTYAIDDAEWLCVADEGGGGSEGPENRGDVYTWERSLSDLGMYPKDGIGPPPEVGAQGMGCCLSAGQAVDGHTSAPC